MPVPTRTTNKKRDAALADISFLYFRKVDLLGGNGATLLLDAGSLTSELAQIVKLSAAYLTNLVDLNALDVG